MSHSSPRHRIYTLSFNLPFKSQNSLQRVTHTYNPTLRPSRFHLSPFSISVCSLCYYGDMAKDLSCFLSTNPAQEIGDSLFLFLAPMLQFTAISVHLVYDFWLYEKCSPIWRSRRLYCTLVVHNGTSRPFLAKQNLHTGWKALHSLCLSSVCSSSWQGFCVFTMVS